MHAVNLIPKARREAGIRRGRLRRWQGVCGAYAAFLVLTFLVVRVLGAGDRRSVDQRLQDTGVVTESARATVASLRTRLGDLTTQRRRNLSVGVQPDWSLVLARLAADLGEEIVLDEVRLASTAPAAPSARPLPPGDRVPEPPDALHLELTGLGLSQASVNGLLLRLEDTGLFSAVKPLDTQREPFGASYAVAFRIACTLDTTPRTPSPAGMPSPEEASP